MHTLKALLTQDEKGVGMTEFAIVLALVSVLCIAGYQMLGDGIGVMLEPVLRVFG